ncbi:MAG: hypothetical protein WCG25_06360 [bacterium]
MKKETSNHQINAIAIEPNISSLKANISNHNIVVNFVRNIGTNLIEIDFLKLSNADIPSLS